jgi:hypothetical protein
VQQKIAKFKKAKKIKVVIDDKYYKSRTELLDIPEEAIKKIQEYISWKQIYIRLNPA